jgi:uncharacterized membrane protein YtjA (UPF0391 family)
MLQRASMTAWRSFRDGDLAERGYGHAPRYVIGPTSDSNFRKGPQFMLYWAAVFFIIALAAAVLGFSGIAANAAGIAKILFFVFLILGALSLIFGRRVPVA